MNSSGINPHVNRVACGECHLRDPARLEADGAREAGTRLFVADIETLCLRCHEGVRLNMSHPVAVKPDFPIPPDMLLDWKGEITCTTCHFMHAGSDSPYGRGNSSLLRRNSTGRAFCQECHQQGFLSVRALGHSIVRQKAHRRRYTRTGSDRLLHVSSRECMTCHDGSVSGDAGTTTQGPGIWRHQGYSGRSSHPVGVDYYEAMAGNTREYTPVSQLPSSIILPDGRVECVSCHNLYAKNEHLLVISNEGSRLCLTCHVK